MNIRITLSLLGLCAIVGCDIGQFCTEIGCRDGLAIDLTADEPLPVGSYTLEISGDSYTLSCPFVVSDDPADCDDVDTCVSDSCQELSWSYSDEGVRELFVFADTLDEALDLTVDRDDGTVLLQTTEVIAYETSSPNGEDCGPTCTAARLELELVAAGL